MVVLGIRAARLIEFILVHQDPLPVAIEIIKLPAPGGPEQDSDGGDPQNQHARYQTIDHVHCFNPSLR